MPDLMAVDNVHLNADSYANIAEEILSFIRKLKENNGRSC
jgi:lysophospholipase L1-like esterase